MDWEKAKSWKRGFRIAAGTYSAVVCAAMTVYMIITFIMSRGTWDIYSAFLGLLLFAAIPLFFAGVIMSSMIIANKIPKVFSCIMLVFSVQMIIAGLASEFILALIIILISGTNCPAHYISGNQRAETEQSNVPAGNKR